MSSIIIDRPVVTTPSSEWGGDPAEGRLSPRYTPTSYFRPTARSSPYSRPHPPTSGELEVPGSYPRDPRVALDDLSASAQDYDIGVKDFLPAKEDVQNAVSSVTNAAMGAIGAVSAAGASLVSAASGEDQEETNAMSESIPRTSDDQNLDPAEIVSASDDLHIASNSIDREVLMVPADLPSAPFLVPMPQLSEGALGAAPVSSSVTEETTIAGSDADDYVLFERNLHISETAVVPTDALAVPKQDEDDLGTAGEVASYVPVDAAATDSSLGDFDRTGDVPFEAEPPANNDSVDSLGSQSGVGNGMGLVSSESVLDRNSSAAVTSLEGPEDPAKEVGGDFTVSKDAEEIVRHSPPVSKLHLAAGAVGLVGTAATLIAKVAKRKSVPSPDTITEESHSDVTSFSSGLPSDLPKSPAIFNEEFAAQAPNPAPVGRPVTSLSSGIPSDIPNSPAIFNEEFAAQAPSPAPVGRPDSNEMSRKDDIGQGMWTPGPGSRVQEDEAPISSSYSSDNAGVEPSTHTPAVAPPFAPAPMREFSTLSSPAALAGEEKPVARDVDEEAGMNCEDVDASNQDSSKIEKVGKLNLLAGAVGAAGVAAGLVAKIASRKSPVRTGEDANQFRTPEDDVNLNSPIPSDLPKSPAIFTDEFASAPPMISGEHLTVPPSPNASDSPLARLPDDTTSKDMNIGVPDAMNQYPANLSTLPIPVVTYRSDAEGLPEPGAWAEHGLQIGTFMTSDFPSDEPAARNDGSMSRAPGCAAVGSQGQSDPLSDSQRFRSRSIGGMGVNGLYVPDAHPPFALMSTLPEVGEVAEPISTVEAPLGTKVHGEPLRTEDGLNIVDPSLTAGYSAANKHHVGDGNVPVTSAHPGYASSGSSGRSYDEVVDGPNGPTTVRKKGKSKKTSLLVEKVKEKLRF